MWHFVHHIIVFILPKYHAGYAVGMNYSSMHSYMYY
jgi:hypothetical protein